MLIVFNLLQSSAREVRALEEVQKDQLALWSLLQMVCGETLDRLGELASDSGQPRLQQLIDGLRERTGAFPDRPITVRCVVEPAPGAVRGLILIRLQAVRAGGDTLELRRLRRCRSRAPGSFSTRRAVSTDQSSSSRSR
jgi:hypothetical protein